MAKTVTIQLSTPLTGHSGQVSAVTLREPTAEDFWEIGRVKRYGHTPDGTVFTVENEAAYRAYVDRCLIDPPDKLILSQIKSLADGIKIRNAIDDFFADALKTI